MIKYHGYDIFIVTGHPPSILLSSDSLYYLGDRVCVCLYILTQPKNSRPFCYLRLHLICLYNKSRYKECIAS